MTTTTANKPVYRIAALEDTPRVRSGRGHIGIYVQALLTLNINQVAVFEPCPAKHYGVKKWGCHGAQMVYEYAKLHGLKVSTWHVDGNFYIARLA